MESRAKLLGHAIHPMLIPFPLGLLSTAAIFDVIVLITGHEGLATATYFVILAGLVGGLLASVFGWADWLGVPDGTRAKNVGLIHGLGNALVLALFAISLLLRAGASAYEPSAWAVALSLGGAALVAATGWLGGELVERLRIGVDDGAHADAPSSLSQKHLGSHEQAAG